MAAVRRSDAGNAAIGVQHRRGSLRNHDDRAVRQGLELGPGADRDMVHPPIDAVDDSDNGGRRAAVRQSARDHPPGDPAVRRRRDYLVRLRALEPLCGELALHGPDDVPALAKRAQPLFQAFRKPPPAAAQGLGKAERLKLLEASGAKAHGERDRAAPARRRGLIVIDRISARSIDVRRSASTSSRRLRRMSNCCRGPRSRVTRLGQALAHPVADIVARDAQAAALVAVTLRITCA